MKKRNKRSTLLIEKLEGIGREIFKPGYNKILKRHIGKKPGVYALYKKEKLYYVGQAQELVSRIKLHLSNRHARKWDNFSVYIAQRRRYVPDLEAVVIAIADPKGNERQPQLARLRKATTLKRLIEKDMKEEAQKIMNPTTKVQSKRKSKRRTTKTNKKNAKAGNKRFSLAGLFSENKLLRGEHKKNIHSACLLTSGKVLYKGKGYSSPSGASKEAKGLKTDNGWTFWQIQDHQKRWIKLNDLKKKGTLKKVA